MRSLPHLLAIKVHDPQSEPLFPLRTIKMLDICGKLSLVWRHSKLLDDIGNHDGESGDPILSTDTLTPNSTLALTKNEVQAYK